MIQYKKPYIYCPFCDEFSSANIETLATTLARHHSVGDLAAPSQHHVTLLHVAPPPCSLILLPADRWSSSLMSLKVGASRSPSCALLQSLPILKDPLGEFPSMRRVCRVKPHRKQCPVAHVTPGSGEPPPLTTTPPRQPYLSRPHLDQRPRLDHWYPFILIKSEPQIEESTAESDPLWHGLMSWDHGPGPSSYVMEFSIEK
jgi:hypothetical protein